jgi:hypothetical protein
VPGVPNDPEPQIDIRNVDVAPDGAHLLLLKKVLRTA